MTDNDPTSGHEIFGPYEVYERLGIGGMATVHRAKESGIEGFERIVALKRLLPHLAEDTSFVKAFKREAELASKLQHANIVQLYELGRVKDVLFMSMEYIEGRDVRAILRQARKVTGPPPMSVFLSLMTQLCDALDYAHNRTDQNGERLGIVHRDVSPSNLLVTPSGHLKVIDFGIAKAQTQKLRTETGRVKGKLAYMAPEVLKAQEMDARSDVFSVAVVAHELLTARPLFAARNEYQTLLRLKDLEVVPPSTHNRKCPPELDQLLLRALERDPGKRWQSAAELRDELHYLRSRYQVSATNREVASWLEWAFALKAPQTGSFAAVSSGAVPRTRTRSGTYQTVSPARAFARAPSSTPPECIASVQDPGSDASPLPPPPGGPLALEGRPDNVPEPSSAADDVSDAAVSYAWGEDEDKQAAPIALDDIPDVSVKVISVAASAASGGASLESPAESSGTSPGVSPGQLSGENSKITATGQGDADPDVTSPYVPKGGADVSTETSMSAVTSVRQLAIASQRKRRNKRIMAVAGAAVAVAAIALLFIVSNQKEAPPPVAAALPVPQTAGIKFLVEPKTAVVTVNGHESHRGTPYKLDVKPGKYRVEIAHPGFKSIVTDLEVEAGESHVVRWSLEAAKNEKSQVTIKLKRSDVVVHLDGQALPQGAPVVAEVAPGQHVLSIRDEDGNELWSEELAAAASTNYEFQPSLKRKRKRKKRDKNDDDDKARTVAAMEMAQDIEVVSDDSEAAGSRGEIAITPSAGDPLSGLETAEPPPAPKAPEKPKKPKGPVTIPPTMAKKISGKVPTLSAPKRYLPSSASAKLCIDTRGKVKSATVLTSMRENYKSQLSKGLRRWRYKPYKVDGEAVPACFAVNFQIVH